MKLPKADSVRIERDKIVSYLLNPEHRYGASKARFLADFGFTLKNWRQLETALRELAFHNEVTRQKATPFGPRFEVDGNLRTPSGLAPRMRSVWQMDERDVAPRLITVYPLEVEDDTRT